MFKFLLLAFIPAVIAQAAAPVAAKPEDVPSMKCAANFPGADAPKALTSLNFENAKAELWYTKAVATLATCLVQEDKCADSKKSIDKLAGAMGSVTQKIRSKSAGSFANFSKGIMSDKALTDTIKEHAACIEQQDGGIESFLKQYAALVKKWVIGGRRLRAD